jgi:hypothetical protein
VRFADKLVQLLRFGLVYSQLLGTHICRHISSCFACALIYIFYFHIKSLAIDVKVCQKLSYQLPSTHQLIIFAITFKNYKVRVHFKKIYQSLFDKDVSKVKIDPFGNFRAFCPNCTKLLPLQH